MSMQQLMTKGRKDIQDIDNILKHSERIVEDTKAVGTQVRRRALVRAGKPRAGAGTNAPAGPPCKVAWVCPTRGCAGMVARGDYGSTG